MISMNILIELATPRDFKELAELDLIASQEFQKWIPQSTDDFLNTYQQSKFFIVIAKIDKKIVGYLDASFDKKFKKNIYIENVYVAKEFRRNGTATLLVDKFLDYWLGKANAIALLTSDKNKEIFEKIGFQKTMNYMEYKKK